MTELRGRSALVTGASSGIGRGIARALAAEGMRVVLVGRDPGRLAAAAAECRAAGAAEARDVVADLSTDEGVAAAAGAADALDVLVHSAGYYARGAVSETPAAELDRHYAANLRGPYELTRLLLPALKRDGGDIVFINSTQGLAASPGVSHFAATQHAFKALADALRAEVNDDGIRVLTIFCGRTATPRQEGIYAKEGRAYAPEKLMQPEDVAALVLAALKLPRSAEVTSLSMRPARKSY
jgi:NADP-dependent 3-hydroxy acid dehydrogenase YdfG